MIKLTNKSLLLLTAVFLFWRFMLGDIILLAILPPTIAAITATLKFIYNKIFQGNSNVDIIVTEKSERTQVRNAVQILIDAYLQVYQQIILQENILILPQAKPSYWQVIPRSLEKDLHNNLNTERYNFISNQYGTDIDNLSFKKLLEIAELFNKIIPHSFNNLNQKRNRNKRNLKRQLLLLTGV